MDQVFHFFRGHHPVIVDFLCHSFGDIVSGILGIEFLFEILVHEDRHHRGQRMFALRINFDIFTCVQLRLVLLVGIDGFLVLLTEFVSLGVQVDLLIDFPLLP